MPTSTLRHPWRRRGWTQPDSLTAAGRVGGAKASLYLPAPLARQANMQGCKWQEEVLGGRPGLATFILRRFSATWQVQGQTWRWMIPSPSRRRYHLLPSPLSLLPPSTASNRQPPGKVPVAVLDCHMDKAVHGGTVKDWAVQGPYTLVPAGPQPYCRYHACGATPSPMHSIP